MENGSGGYMGGTFISSLFFHVVPQYFSDIVCNGGKFGIWVGNQQHEPFHSFLRTSTLILYIDSLFATLRSTTLKQLFSVAGTGASYLLFLSNVRLT